jgi:hypothetical protein
MVDRSIHLAEGADEIQAGAFCDDLGADRDCGLLRRQGADVEADRCV